MSELLKAEIRILKDENSILKEQVIQLKELLLPAKFDCQSIFELSPKLAALLTLLLTAKGTIVSKEKALSVLYATHFGVEDTPEPKIIDVYICKLRPKLKKWDIEIKTVLGTRLVY